MRIVSFYTVDTPYKEEADLLKESCEAVGLDIDIVGVPNRGSWDANHKWKPFVILRAMNIHDNDILFVDADATIHNVADESVFDIFKHADVAAHVMDKASLGQNTKDRKFSLMTGTIYFSNSDISREVLYQWQAENEKHPRKWGQQNLEAVLDFDTDTGLLKRDDVSFFNMPDIFCGIDVTMPDVPGVIVQHHQASRRLRKKV